MNRLALLLPLLLVAATGQRSGSQTITGATSSQRGTVRLTGDLGGTADNPSIVRANAAQVTATGTGVTKSAADWMRDGPVNGGMVTATGATTARSQADRAADVFNVKDFGAVGDCVADDLPALNAARDAARLAGGGVIYLPRPPCAYRVTDTWLVGQGRTLSETDLRYATGMNDDFDWSTLPSYSAANREANILEPLYDIRGDRGTYLWGDFSSPTRKAILYYSAIGDQHRNERHKGAATVSGLSFIGQDGIVGTSRPFIDPFAPLSSANRQVGLAWFQTPLALSGLTFEQLDVGYASAIPYWSSGEQLITNHCNTGAILLAASNTEWHSLRSFYAREWGLVISGSAIVLNYGTEQNVRDIWVPFADYMQWNGGYVECAAPCGNSAWSPSTSYSTVGVVARNAGNLYRVTVGGVSAASGGPTTTAADITDGTAHWEYLGPEYGYVFGDVANAEDTFQVGRSSINGVKFNRADNKGLYLFASRVTLSGSRIRDDKTMVKDAYSEIAQFDMDSAIDYDAGSLTNQAVTHEWADGVETISGTVSVTGRVVSGDRAEARGYYTANNGVLQWARYQSPGDAQLYERDLVNGRQHMQLVAGTSSAVAKTILRSRLFVEGYVSLGSADTEPRIQGGAGSPEGVVTAPAGSLYLNSSGGAGTTLYVKEIGAGNTGWVAK